MVTRFRVIIAVYNRREVTVRIINQLKSMVSDSIAIDITVCDDMSRDLTPEIIQRDFPGVHLVQTGGNFFWAKSMHLADTSSFKFNYDYLVWLNDDTDLDRNAFANVLQDYKTLLDPQAILIGALRDPESKIVTYTGCLHSVVNRKVHLEFIPPLGIPTRVGMFSGNFVVVPRGLREVMGPISKKYSHGWADMEYGYRAKKFGYSSYLMSDFVGYSELNPIYTLHKSKNENIFRRFLHAYSRKGYHPVDYFRFCITSFGFRGIGFYIQNILRVLKEVIKAN